MSFAPLADLRVLDASRVLAGPYCAQMLGDLGADVVKIERPDVGDDTRAWGPPFVGELSAYFLACNRNKRSLALDLAQPEGRALLLQLAARCDVLIENFLPADAKKLGLDVDTLRSACPRLIVCSISGFGRTGPWADVPGYDFGIQGMSGLMAITGPVEGPPSKVGTPIVDLVAGLHATTAILACVHARKSSGHGYAIDLALFDCALAIQANVAQAFLVSGRASRLGNAHPQIVPYELFPVADGWLILAVGNDAQFRRFCVAAERAEWADDARYATNPARVQHRETLIPQIAAALRGRNRAEWERRLAAAEVPHAPVLDHAQAFAHPQAESRQMRVVVRGPDGVEIPHLGSPIRVDGEAPDLRTAAPRLGADADAVLRDLLGLDAAAVADLRARTIV